jgi:hypothetical protein
MALSLLVAPLQVLGTILVAASAEVTPEVMNAKGRM